MVHIHPADTLVMYWSTPSAYGIRFFDVESGSFTIAGRASLGTTAIQLPITLSEHQELSSLRQAIAWGAPIFEPSHADYGKAINRIAELEMKERNACEVGKRAQARSPFDRCEKEVTSGN
jgi:hypothetical protein